MILHLYYGRQFLKYFILSLLGLSLLVIFLDILELFRRSVNKSHIDIYDILHLSFYKLWRSIYLVFPFAIFLTTVIFFLQKLRTNELVALKSVGTSFFQILLAPFVCVVVIGILNMGVVNHIAAQFFKEFEILESRLFNQSSNHLAISADGLWLREEKEGNRRTLIYAEGASEGGRFLHDLQVFLLTSRNDFLQRISADSAELYDSYWLLQGVEVLDGRGDIQNLNFFVLETDLTPSKIESGVSGPNSLSLWELPTFITGLQDSGFSAVSYRLHMQRLIAEPLFFIALLILSSGLLLRVKRREQVKQVLQITFISVILVIGLYVVNNLIYAWGLQGLLPIGLAAWVPPLIGLLFACGILLRLEES